MTNKIPDVIHVMNDMNFVSAYWLREPIDNDVNHTSYTRTSIHEAEVKRLREALEVARVSLDARFHAIMRSGPSIRAYPDILTVHKTALDNAAKTLTAIDAALGE